MKNTHLFTVATMFLIAFTTLMSCSTENLELTNQNSFAELREKSDDDSDPGSCISGITKINGILKFTDQAHYDQTIACLEAAVEAHNDAFDALYSGLTDVEIEAMEEAIGFNEYQPLIDFENQFSFSSLRNLIDNQITKWLKSDNPDFNLDPDNHIIVDEITRTLLTTNCEVMIGDDVLNLCQIEEGEESERSGTCHETCRTVESFIYDNGNKAFTVTVKIKHAWWFGSQKSKLKSKIVSYKKKNNGGWKRYKTNIYTNVSGVISTSSNCSLNGPHVFIENGPKRRKKLVAEDVAQYLGWVQNGFLAGYGSIIDYNATGTVDLFCN